MNKVIINGRLIKDPEIQPTKGDGLRCTFFIANDVWLGQNKETGFYRVTAWGKIGKIIADTCVTGTELFITGRLEQHRYEDEMGKMIYDTGIVLEAFDFGARASNTDSHTGGTDGK